MQQYRYVQKLTKTFAHYLYLSLPELLQIHFLFQKFAKDAYVVYRFIIFRCV